MVNLTDIVYVAAAVALAPVWLLRRQAREKVRSALRDRLGHVPRREADGPAVTIHAVSVGEVNATRSFVVQLLDRRPDLHLTISVTTETGFRRAGELFSGDERVSVVRYPLDFSGAVRRLLDALRPDLVVLMELEVWPNFTRECRRRGIPILVINGRVSESSFRYYRIARPLIAPMFRRLEQVCVQDETYRKRFITMGVSPDRIVVTGTMKFDTAEVCDRVPGAEQLAREIGLQQGERVWVCGSTGPGEERIVLEVYRRLLPDHPDLRLIIVPRKAERFDEVAELIRSTGFPLLRRSLSRNRQSAIDNRQSQIILGDTMGELRTFYSLAEIVFVGRTLVDLGPKQHGSDMIEPAALAKPVVVGPYTGNFAEPMIGFRAAGAIREVNNKTELQLAVAELLGDRPEASEMARRAKEAVRANQGATLRHVEIVLGRLAQSRPLASSI